MSTMKANGHRSESAVKERPKNEKRNSDFYGQESIRVSDSRQSNKRLYEENPESKSMHLDYKLLFEKQKTEINVLQEKANIDKKEIEYLKRQLEETKRPKHEDKNSEIYKKLKDIENEKEYLNFKIFEFMQKTAKYVPCDYKGEKPSLKEIERYLNNVDVFIGKLVSDNKYLTNGKSHNSNNESKSTPDHKKVG
jgi:hypothetical protein